MLQIMHDCIVSDHVIEFREQAVTLCDPFTAHKIRRASTAAALLFRQRCSAELTQRQLLETRHWQVHHVTPVRFGGPNEFSNLALVQPVLHAILDRIIDRQTSEMVFGETRTIKVPYMRGFVWAL